MRGKCILYNLAGLKHARFSHSAAWLNFPQLKLNLHRAGAGLGIVCREAGVGRKFVWDIFLGDYCEKPSDVKLSLHHQEQSTYLGPSTSTVIMFVPIMQFFRFRIKNMKFCPCFYQLFLTWSSQGCSSNTFLID